LPSRSALAERGFAVELGHRRPLLRAWSRAYPSFLGFERANDAQDSHLRVRRNPSDELFSTSRRGWLLCAVIELGVGSCADEGRADRDHEKSVTA
jgi:hypothetical protein